MSKKSSGGFSPAGILQAAAGFVVRFCEHAYHNVLWLFRESGRANRALDSAMPGLIARTTIPPSYIPWIKLGLVTLIVGAVYFTGAYMVILYIFAGFTALQALAGGGRRH